MSLSYQMHTSNNAMDNDVYMLSKLYDEESVFKRIKHFDKYTVSGAYALMHSSRVEHKNVKNAYGFGVCFPHNKTKKRRVIVFDDMIAPRFLDLAVAHELTHLAGGDEMDAFSLEAAVAKSQGMWDEYLAFNQDVYPHRVQLFERYGLL